MSGEFPYEGYCLHEVKRASCSEPCYVCGHACKEHGFGQDGCGVCACKYFRTPFTDHCAHQNLRNECLEPCMVCAHACKVHDWKFGCRACDCYSSAGQRDDDGEGYG